MVLNLTESRDVSGVDSLGEESLPYLASLKSKSLGDSDKETADKGVESERKNRYQTPRRKFSTERALNRIVGSMADNMERQAPRTCSTRQRPFFIKVLL